MIENIAILIPLISGGIVSIISTIQNSKCVNIRLCCGLFSCSRKVPDIEPNLN